MKKVLLLILLILVMLVTGAVVVGSSFSFEKGVVADKTITVDEQVNVTAPYLTVVLTKLGLGELAAKDGWILGLQIAAFVLFTFSAFFLGIVLKTKFKKGERKLHKQEHRHINSAFFEEPQKRDKIQF